jgi:hypothetical protein
MDDKQAKEQLIKFVRDRCYSHIRDKAEARQLSVERCKEIQERWTWPVLKKASAHSACTSMSELSRLCAGFKKLLNEKK